MKIKIKSCNGNIPYYLSEGVDYEATDVHGDGTLFSIVTDDGGVDYVNIEDCPHLNDGSWEVVDA